MREEGKRTVRTIKADRLRSATSENDVIELVRNYVGDWLPEELAKLPFDCRPGKLRDSEDLNELALKLARACVSFEVEPEELRAIEEMDAFVGQACQRIAEIERRVTDYSPTFTTTPRA
jgi:hypothetical protein